MDKMIERKPKKIVTILLGALISWVLLIAVAQASTDVRRIDTENVVKSTDIHEQGTKSEDDATDSHETEADSEHSQPEESDSHGKENEAQDKEAESNGDETESHSAGSASDTEHEGEVHHPAWMIPGWQSIFTVLAVGYFALGVTFLPKIMAKEEHN